MAAKKVAIIRMEGTNNEYEAFQSFSRVGLEPHYVHVNELKRKSVSLEDFSAIFIPGGFSAGDYIRAGVLFARRLEDAALIDISRFVDEDKPVIGICNGFQVLTEMGFLPGWSPGQSREIVLAPNDSNRYECRYTYVRVESHNPILAPQLEIGSHHLIPVAHAEGKIRIMKPETTLSKLEDNGQILFRYSTPGGDLDGYPWNPNGSVSSVAAVSNPHGNVIGMMPHPERLFYYYRRIDRQNYGDLAVGQKFFTAIRDYIIRNDC
ncbi:MAG: phosphoribosylformylglycinamidine synthase subunit PurQ [Thermoplasmataceae archaeon]